MYASAPSTELDWRSIYPPEVCWSQPLDAKPVYAFLDEAVQRWPERPSMDFMGRRYSYAELGDLVDRAAQGLRELGVKDGARVGLCLPNCPYHVVMYFAVLKAGGIVVNFNPLYTAREIASQSRDSQTGIMVTLDLDAIYSKVREVLDEGVLHHVVVCSMRDCLPRVKGALFGVLKRSQLASIAGDGRHVTFASLISHGRIQTPAPVVPQRDLAVLQYTGGTTGSPKGAMLTHENVAANTQQVSSWMPDLEFGQERILAVLPFFHVFAMTVVMNMGIAIGAQLILLPRFDLADTLKTIHRKRPTLFPGVPTIYTAINGAANLNRYDLSSIKYCISGGAPLPVEVKKEFESLTGCVLVEGYGLTEASPVVTCNPLSGSERKEGSIGLPLPGTHIEMRSLEDPRQPVAIGERGEVCVRGPQVMAGYWQREEETANVFVDGWLRTGDVGYLDEQGYSYLVDRIKDVILCGGYNVYPRVIEEAIYLHPAVAEVAVIAIDDHYRGQSPKAFVRLRDGASLDEQELSAFLSDKLSKIELPRAFEFRSELPKTQVGKLSKKALQEEEVARQSGGGPDTDAAEASA
jgi:long-chain acyl-CoA synthetase